MTLPVICTDADEADVDEVVTDPPAKSNVAPMRFVPVTVTGIRRPAGAPSGTSDVMEGRPRANCSVPEETVDPPTVTDTPPEVAPGGITTTNWLGVAETTLACTPPMKTTFPPGTGSFRAS